MKKLLLLFALISLSNFTQSQSVYLRSGVNFSDMVSEKNKIERFQAGFIGGVSIKSEEERLINFGMDIFFSQKGIHYKENGKSIKDMSNYVEIPLLINMKLTKSFSLNVGPYMGFWMGTRRIMKKPNDGYEVDRLEFRESNSNLDVGGNLGIQFQKGKILVELRGSAGVNDLKHKDLSGKEVRNQVASLILGYRVG